MIVTLRRVLIAICGLLIVGVMPATAAVISDGFEWGVGHDGAIVFDQVYGLLFSTLLGEGLKIGDITTTNYSVTSDNGTFYNGGEYFVSENAAAYLTDEDDILRVDFQYGLATSVTISYSSLFPFHLYAYDTNNVLVAWDTGPANCKSEGGTELEQLTVSTSTPEIAYVLLHDSGGFWLIDNIVADVVPEPCTMIAFAAGLTGLVIRRRR